MTAVNSWLRFAATATVYLLLQSGHSDLSSAASSVTSMTASAVADVDKVVLDGDILLGGLFPIHSSADTGETRCGRMDSHRGIQRMEAMIFTLLEINANRSYLNYGRHTITLGGLLFDTCSKETYALEKALEFVKNSLTHEYDGEFVCQYPNGTQLPALRSSSRKHSKKPIRGVVGGAYSQVSIQVANLLRLFSIPQISYASTSAALGDKNRFEYFARTLPSDTQQAKALADIVNYFNWTFVSTVFSKGDYGEGGIQSFETEVDKLSVCIAERLLINLEPTKDELDIIVDRLQSQPRARVVVMFTREDHTEKFLDAVRRANVTNKFVWISADGWGKSYLPVTNNTLVASGALTLEISAGEIPNFNRYYTGLKPGQLRHSTPTNFSFTNPFFDEYWQLKFDCHFPGVAGAPQGASKKVCAKNLAIEADKFKQEPKVPFVYDAVYTFANGLRKVRDLVCSKQPDDADTKATDLFASCIRNISAFSGKDFYNILISEENFFVNSAKRKVQYTKQGDGIGTYIIYNYRRNRETKHLDYRRVGEWSKEGGLTLDVNQSIYWSGGVLDMPISRCSEECAVHQKKVYSNKGNNKNKCCWTCNDCQQHQRVSENGDACVDCHEDEGPTPDRRSCVPIPVQYMQWTSWYAIVPIILSTMGILSTSFIIATFFRYNETPLVKASGRELSYLLLTGCLLCYLMTFLLITKPTAFTCALQRIGIGVGFAVIYASLLTKTNRIARIFEAASQSAKRPPFISPKSQLLIAGALISVQLACTLIWIVLSNPGTRIHHPQRLEAILRCNIDDKSLIASLLYNMVLILICTYYAIKTRRIPENFNESKFIGFTMYTTCIIWLAFVPLFFGTHSSFEVQITTLCISISLSASVALACLFTPKVYIIFFQPEKNVRKLTMNSNHYKKQASSSAGSCGNHKEGGGSIEGDSNSTTLRAVLPGQLYRYPEVLDDDRLVIRSATLANPGLVKSGGSGIDGIDKEEILDLHQPHQKQLYVQHHEFHPQQYEQQQQQQQQQQPEHEGSQQEKQPFNCEHDCQSPILHTYAQSRCSSDTDSANYRYEDGFV